MVEENLANVLLSICVTLLIFSVGNKLVLVLV